jgi:succinate dehydrogenase/fumarate reductase flavoprotein subunit
MEMMETDVVVVGFGGAGATAALTAHQAGARVVVLEKMPKGGGSTQYSGGTMRTYLDLTQAADYFEALCEGTTERAVIDTFVAESSRNGDWIQTLGAEIAPLHPHFAKRFPGSLVGAAFPSVRGAAGMGPRIRVKGPGTAGGIDLWGALSRTVAATNIVVKCGYPADQLVYDKEQGVTGVIASNGDETLHVKAKRGVILTCGGYAYNRAMHSNYLGQQYFGMCNSGNTGDGIRMAGEIGADMWHMNACATSMGYKFPEFECAIRQLIPGPGFIYVDQQGARFMDETGADAHIMWAPTSMIDTKTLVRPRNPCCVIFDEDTRLKGPVGATFFGRISDIYQWSADNSAEIKKGWIKVADTIGDLAPQLGMRPDLLQATVANYNLACVAGYDATYGREPEYLVPIARPPFYALETRPTMFNTQGGPKRNERAEILNRRGQPIKGLYSAGEFGSLWHRNYPGAGNVSEALAFGRIAGRNAAARNSR